MVYRPILRHLRAIAQILIARSIALFRWYRARSLRYQIAIAIAVIVFLFIVLSALGGGKTSTGETRLRTVSIDSVESLSGTGSGASVIGTVRAVTEAALRAETSGTVTRIGATMGSSVPAGFILAELENSAARAAVLQAEGAYDAALAARSAVSPVDSKTAAVNAYRSLYTTLDTALETQVDTFFGAPTPTGPNLLINPAGSDPHALSRERADIEYDMNAWSGTLENAAEANPVVLLSDAERIAQKIQAFVERLADAANRSDSRATSEQLAALALARATISGAVTTAASARAGYRSGSTASTDSVDAGVKSALGNLRLAQANLERTYVRAPIAGTVNFLPIRVGEFVSALQHVATVAQNGALEIITYVSEEERQALSVGLSVSVEEAEGVITAIAPALDPVNRQIEVRIAVQGNASMFVNGQSVRIALPGLLQDAKGPVFLPLSAVKLSAGNRVVFTVKEGVLVSIPVEIGEVSGDRIEIRTPLEASERIVRDARGLIEGEKVLIASQE